MWEDSCYNLLVRGVNNISKKYRNTLVLDRGKFNKFKGICEIIEAVDKEAECDTFKVTYIEKINRMGIHLGIDALFDADFTKSPNLLDLIETCDAFSFSVTQEDTIDFAVYFDNLWVKKGGIK